MADDTLSGFQHELLSLLPRLRAYAYALAGDRDSADDLVQSAVLQCLSQRDKFKPGTSLSAWVFRIQRNLFIDRLRRQRPTEPLDETTIAATRSCKPSQEDAVLHREFLRAFAQLPAVQREALVLSVIEGEAYEQIAERVGVAEGTIKSRVCRARDRLMQMMMGNEKRVVAELRAAARRDGVRDAGGGPSPARSAVLDHGPG